jgi:hypothetical protein
VAGSAAEAGQVGAGTPPRRIPPFCSGAPVAVPDVHLPARPGRGLQHPCDDQDQGRSAPDAAAGCGNPGAERDRNDGHVSGLVLAGTFIMLTVVAGRGPGGSSIRDIMLSLAASPACSGWLAPQDSWEIFYLQVPAHGQINDGARDVAGAGTPVRQNRRLRGADNRWWRGLHGRLAVASKRKRCAGLHTHPAQDLGAGRGVLAGASPGQHLGPGNDVSGQERAGSPGRHRRQREGPLQRPSLPQNRAWRGNHPPGEGTTTVRPSPGPSPSWRTLATPSAMAAC